MKYQRQAKILELIEKHDIETQETLTEYLKKSGFNVTQATISRDIKDLMLVKTISKNGKYCYSTVQHQEIVISDRLRKIFRDAVLSIESAGNTIVIKTLAGSANAAAAAIDSQAINGIIGTIAGDDTIFVLAKSENLVAEIVEKFHNSLK